jgi:hypothetical protein
MLPSGTIQGARRHHPRNTSSERFVERKMAVEVAVVERTEEKIHDQLGVAAGWNLGSRDRALDDGQAFLPDPVHKALAPGNGQVGITLRLRDEMGHRAAAALKVRQPDPALGDMR